MCTCRDRGWPEKGQQSGTYTGMYPSQPRMAVLIQVIDIHAIARRAKSLGQTQWTRKHRLAVKRWVIWETMPGIVEHLAISPIRRYVHSEGDTLHDMFAMPASQRDTLCAHPELPREHQLSSSETSWAQASERLW